MDKISNYIEKSIEKVSLFPVENQQTGNRLIAEKIARLIKGKQSKGKMTVLGLSGESSFIPVYDELVRIHQEENLSFKDVVVFDVNEYYPIDPSNKKSVNYILHKCFFDRIDINPKNIFLLNGNTKINKILDFCASYEDQIREKGGMDLVLLNIGRDGEIGNNEPGSMINSRTRVVSMNATTISDMSVFFGKGNVVPTMAITMGIGTILNAKNIILTGWGEEKSSSLKNIVEDQVSITIPGSLLQLHSNVTVYADPMAASKFTRTQSPWLVGKCKWTPRMTKRAVTWLSEKIEKPILKLTDEDYCSYGLSDLLKEQNGSYKLNIKVFSAIRDTITGWPGGKPGDTTKNHPERPEPAKKRIVIFSPHPDDDVISMGGTIQRLAEQGHDVHLAYETSGNIAVFDDDAIRFSQFALDLTDSLKIKNDNIRKDNEDMVEFFNNKKYGEADSPYARLIKTLIRVGEASAACRFCGIKKDRVHFLNLPFYETGHEKKGPVTEKDVNIVKELLEEVKPHQIFAAGDFQDPHGTHAVCFNVIVKALKEIRNTGGKWLDNCNIWLYRGAWQEWDIEDIEMAIPISPEELLNKRKAIFKHQSQKDFPAFPGNDKREFWQRSEDRNKATARIYDRLGLAEYEAIEAFVKYPFDHEEDFLK